MTKMAENNSETGHPRVEERLRIGPIIRDIAIIWVLTFFGGFVIGVALGGLPRDAQRQTNAYAVSNILFGTVGFIIAGYLAPARKWPHLGFVAVGVWLMGLINVVFFGSSIPQWIGGAIFLVIMMGLGGVISNIFTRANKPTIEG